LLQKTNEALRRDAKSAIEAEAIDCDFKAGCLKKDHLRPAWPNMVWSQEMQDKMMLISSQSIFLSFHTSGNAGSNCPFHAVLYMCIT